MEANNNNKPKYSPPRQGRDGLSRQDAVRQVVQDTSASRPRLVRQDSIQNLAKMMKEFDINLEAHKDTTRPLQRSTSLGSITDLIEADNNVSPLINTKDKIKSLATEVAELHLKRKDNNLSNVERSMAKKSRDLKIRDLHRSIRNLYPKSSKKDIREFSEKMIRNSLDTPGH